MSVKAMSAVWDMQITDPAEKFVLLAYADHADHKGGSIYPAVSTIAEKTGYEERSVRRITHRLIENGYLVRQGKGPKGVIRYRIDLTLSQVTLSQPDPDDHPDLTLTTETPDPESANPSGTIIEPSYASDDARDFLDIESPTLTVADSTKPTATNPMTQTHQNPTAFEMNWLENNANKVGERIIRSWHLAQHLENISIEFVRLTGITPKSGEKRGDKKLYALGAADWLKAGYTVADMKEAYALANGRYTVTHLGALFREVQKLRAQRPAPISAAIEDAMTTPNGKVVQHVR